MINVPPALFVAELGEPETVNVLGATTFITKVEEY
jgi:hypothetical protein